MHSGKTVLNNFMWRLAERWGAQLVSFVVSIMLARLLSPDAYGELALVTVFTTVLQVFMDSGFGNALIQKKDADDSDFTTVFYFNLAAALILFGGIFLAAPAIARFYSNSHLMPVVRVMSVSLLISAIKNVQQAYVARKMIFKRFFFATLGGTVGAAAVGIAMAYGGCGVWALVAQSLLNNLTDTVILWFTVKWRPKGKFSLARLKSMFSYGWKLLTSSLLYTLYEKLRELLIGKVYQPSDIAFFEKSNSLPQLIVTNINTSIGSVLFPAMSDAQGQPDRVKAMTRRALQTSTFFLMPMMMGLAVCAEPAVRLLLTDKWLPCVPYLRIFCLTGAFLPVHTANLNAIKALGRSDLFLKQEIIKSVIGIAIIALTVRHGVLMMAYGCVISGVFSQLINSYPNKYLICYPYCQQLRDIFPQLVLSCVMGTAVYCVSLIPMKIPLSLALCVATGVLVYGTAALTLKCESFVYCVRMTKDLLAQVRKHAS